MLKKGKKCYIKKNLSFFLILCFLLASVLPQIILASSGITTDNIMYSSNTINDNNQSAINPQKKQGKSGNPVTPGNPGNSKQGKSENPGKSGKSGDSETPGNPGDSTSENSSGEIIIGAPDTDESTPSDIVPRKDSKKIKEKINNTIKTIEDVNSTIANASNTADESKAIESVIDVIPSISEVINESDDEESTEKLIENYINTLDAVSDTYDKNTNLENAAAISKIINKSVEHFKDTPSTDNIMKKTDAMYTKLVASTDTLIESTTDNEKLVTTVKEIINNTSPLTGKESKGPKGPKGPRDVANPEISGSRVSVENIFVKKTIDKLGEQKITSRIRDGKALAEIDNDAAEKIIKAAANISSSLGDLENTLQQNNIPIEKFNKKISLKIQNSNTTNNIVTNIPNTILSKIRKEGVKSFEVSAGLANITLNTDNVYSDESSNISINVKKLDKNKDLKPEQATLSGMDNVYEFNVSLIDKTGKNNKINAVNKPFTVEIPYTLKPDDNPDNLSAYVYVEDEDHLENPNDKSKLFTWQAVGGKYDPVKKVVKFNRSSFSMYSIVQVNRSFDDLLKYDWAKKDIESMASKGIILEKSSAKFNPSAKITRAEFAGLIVRALGIMDSKAKVTFDDVKPQDWYYSAVASAYKAGIIKGKTSNKFEPYAYITRQEMMQVTYNALVKVLEVEDEGNDYALEGYKDEKSVASWAKKAIALNIKLGIVSGNGNDTLSPNDETIKAEAAVIVKRLYDLM